MSKHSIVLIPGDGIGPEVTRATRRVLEASQHVVVPLQAEEISLDALIALDEEASRHGRALLMASMLQWLAGDLTRHKTRYAEEALRYAEQLRSEGEAVRQSEAVGSMWSGWCAMTDFLVHAHVGELKQCALGVAVACLDDHA